VHLNVFKLHFHPEAVQQSASFVQFALVEAPHAAHLRSKLLQSIEQHSAPALQAVPFDLHDIDLLHLPVIVSQVCPGQQSLDE